MKLLVEEEAAKLVNPEEPKQDAIDAVEQHGIVFIMKLTKFVSVAKPPARMFHAKAYSATYRRCGRLHGFDQTRDGQNDHILFIASGAFRGEAV